MTRIKCSLWLVFILTGIQVAGFNSARAGEAYRSTGVHSTCQWSSSLLSQTEMSFLIEQEFSEEGPRCTSEIYMAEMADYMKTQRILGGIGGLLGGGLTIALAAGYDKEEHDSDFDYQTYGIVTGMTSIGIGIYQLAVPSKAEKEYEAMKWIPDIEKREKYGAVSLESIADKARSERIIGGVLLGIGAAIFLGAQPIEEDDGDVSDWNYYLGGFAALGTIYSLAVKSKQEKIYDKYLEAKGVAEEGNKELGIFLGPDGRGGGEFRIVYGF